MSVNAQKTSNSRFYAVLGAATLLLAAAMWLYAPRAEAQRVGPFMLVAHSNQTANVGIFRIDTSNGGVSFCVPEGAGSGMTVRCSASAE